MDHIPLTFEHDLPNRGERIGTDRHDGFSDVLVITVIDFSLFSENEVIDKLIIAPRDAVRHMWE